MTALPAFTRLTELQIDAEEWNFPWMFHLRVDEYQEMGGNYVKIETIPSARLDFF
jgi:hypothetical protein